MQHRPQQLSCLTPQTLSVATLDNDVAGFSLSPIAGSLTEDATLP